jgi:hypothetical protein
MDIGAPSRSFVSEPASGHERAPRTSLTRAPDQEHSRAKQQLMKTFGKRNRFELCIFVNAVVALCPGCPKPTREEKRQLPKLYQYLDRNWQHYEPFLSLCFFLKDVELIDLKSQPH